MKVLLALLFAHIGGAHVIGPRNKSKQLSRSLTVRNLQDLLDCQDELVATTQILVPGSINISCPSMCDPADVYHTCTAQSAPQCFEGECSFFALGCTDPDLTAVNICVERSARIEYDIDLIEQDGNATAGANATSGANGTLEFTWIDDTVVYEWELTEGSSNVWKTNLIWGEEAESGDCDYVIYPHVGNETSFVKCTSCQECDDEVDFALDCSNFADNATVTCSDVEGPSAEGPAAILDKIVVPGIITCSDQLEDMTQESFPQATNISCSSFFSSATEVDDICTLQLGSQCFDLQCDSVSLGCTNQDATSVNVCLDRSAQVEYNVEAGQDCATEDVNATQANVTFEWEFTKGSSNVWKTNLVWGDDALSAPCEYLIYPDRGNQTGFVRCDSCQVCDGEDFGFTIDCSNFAESATVTCSEGASANDATVIWEKIIIPGDMAVTTSSTTATFPVANRVVAAVVAVASSLFILMH